MKTYSMQWLIALAASVTASAQPPQPSGDRRPPPVPPLIAVFDTDRDRVISAAEIEAAGEALAKLDKNGDGELSPEEIRPQGPRPGRGGPPPHDAPPEDGPGVE